MTALPKSLALPEGTIAARPSGLLTTARVIHALVLRESRTRYGRTMFGYTWGILDPIAWILLFALVRHGLADHAPFGQSVYLFFATGVLTYRFYSNIAGRTIGSISSNSSLLNYPIVNVTDVLIARAILEIATLLVVVLMVWFTLRNLEDIRIIHYPETVMAALATTIALGFALGSFNAVLVGLFPAWQRIWGWMALPIFVTSGKLFVPSEMPPVILDIIWWNPVLHCIEWMRTGVYLDYTPVLDWRYPWIIILTLLPSAFLLERLLRSRLLLRR